LISSAFASSAFAVRFYTQRIILPNFLRKAIELTTQASTRKIQTPMGPETTHRSDDEIDRTRSEDITYAPITSPHTHDNREPLQKQRSNASRSIASRSLERSWSLNDGVSIGGHEVAETAVATEDTAYIVSWDEKDPMNPRNMSKARRWLIVSIVSMGSLCV
jgi:hypothetical protein